jgi:hypothetical protein
MLKNYIEAYAESGLSIFACTKNKTPAIANGFYAATTDTAILQTQFYRSDFNIGLPCGNTNKIVVIDIDINKDGDIRSVDEFKELVKEKYGDLPETLEVETMSGGRHLYYRIESDTLLSGKARFLDKSIPVDIRANGSYVCAPNGANYCFYDTTEDETDIIRTLHSRCAILPAWIEEYKKKTEIQESVMRANVLDQTEVREIRSALAYIDADDRDTWIRIGMALKSTGSVSAFGLWDEWSKLSEKYNPEDQRKRWNGLRVHEITLASLFHEAKKNGWVSTITTADCNNLAREYGINLTALEFNNGSGGVNLEVINQSCEDKKEEIFPNHLLQCDGLIGEIQRYIMARSIKPQPILSLAASLALVGTLAGRKVRTESDARTNIYVLGVGASGCGKDAPRSAIKKLLGECELSHLAQVEDIASDAAISSAIALSPSQLFLLDEIGRFIRTTSSSNNPHLYNVVSVLMKLYSSSSSVWHGKIYASRENNITVDCPNLCLYGTTVPDTLYKGLTVENLSDGFLSRMMIFESDDPDPETRIFDEHGNRIDLAVNPSPALMNGIVKLHDLPINPSAAGTIQEIKCNPQCYRMTKQATSILHDFCRDIHKFRARLRTQGRPDTLYARTALMAEQISLIASVSRLDFEPIITEREMLYGIALAKHLSDHTFFIAENHVADSSHEHEVKRVLKAIRESGTNGMTLSQITRKTQNVPSYVRKDIIETLLQSEQMIEIQTDQSGTRRSRKFVSMEAAQAMMNMKREEVLSYTTTGGIQEPDAIQENAKEELIQ